jgi:hypothetical protein
LQGCPKVGAHRRADVAVFTNPAAPLTGRALQPPPVLALDDALRARLLGRVDEPGERLIVLLAGVHALRPSQICALTLDAIGSAPNILLTGGCARPLDQLTVAHLRAWLEHRRARWPATANPHLLINRSTARGRQPQLHQRSCAPGRHHHAGPSCRPLPQRSPRKRRRRAPAHLPVRDQRPDRHPLLRRARPAGI